MRKSFLEVKTRAAAVKLAPWAAKIVKVEGGFMAFEFVTDWQAWKRQK
jgi:hypothetical protein